MTAPSRSRSTSVALWGAMAVALTTALFVGARTSDGPPTEAERVESITSRIRCPTCRSQSVADSDAPAAVAIREEVERRVAVGEPDSRIERYLLDRFTADILLEPEAKGMGLLVWVLPAAGTLVVVGALTFVFVRRSRARPDSGPKATDADRDLVEKALKT